MLTGTGCPCPYNTDMLFQRIAAVASVKILQIIAENTIMTTIMTTGSLRIVIVKLAKEVFSCD